MFEILTTATCKWSVRNIGALIEKEVDFRLVDVSDASNGKAAWYKELTPFGKTPALRHDERVVVESLLINEYLEELALGRALLPQDPHARAWARTWNTYCDQEIMKHVRVAAVGTRQEREIALSDLDACLATLEAHVFDHAAPGAYWGGAQPSLTDLCYWSLFDVLERMDASLSTARLLERHHRVRRWARDVLAYPGLVEASRRLDALASDAHGRLPRET